MRRSSDRDRAGLLRFLSPPLARSEFWIVQVLVAVIAAAHILLEAIALTDVEALEAVPVSLNLLPVGYAALVFGFRGAVLTAAWAVVLTLPNAFSWHDGPERVAELWQAGLVVAIGVLVGHRVDRERRARDEVVRYDRERRQLAEAYARSILMAREEERRRVARDLHDGPLQAVMVLWRKLDTPEVGMPSQDALKLHEAQAHVEAIAQDLRRFSRELRPSVLDDLGLFAALRAEATGFERRTGTPTAFRAVGPEPAGMSSDVGVMMLRVCQEALRNVERHAQAHRVAVVLAANPASVRMRISDDGLGLAGLPPPSELVRAGRLGIMGMLERARAVGGMCQVVAARPRGTTVEVQVPLR